MGDQPVNIADANGMPSGARDNEDGSASARPRVLCVDDEVRVLEGLGHHLRKRYEVFSATSGEAGLELIASEGPFTVVLSDQRMPQMNGASFLGKVRRLAPDTTRMLLTGYSDIESAIAAVNEGQVFRFLTKPCPPDQLRSAFEAAEKQYRLVTAERVLLEQTLHGAVKTLTDLLALANPLAFGRAARIRQTVSDVAAALEIEERWPLEVAAMLSQLGSIALPETTAKKLYCGEDLTPEETQMVARMPSVTEALLASIPRLEVVRAILSRATSQTPSRRHRSDSKGDAQGSQVELSGALLRIAVDYDAIESKGLDPQTASDTMRGRGQVYDAKLLEFFLRTRGSATAGQEIVEIPLASLRTGMVLADDLRATNGVLLVTRGFEVTQGFLEKARNYRPGFVQEPLRVVIRASNPTKNSAP
ncbi:MAG: response regulator [Deltaproteobacteria bacterium]|nr:response regulator [Deltaproteobacteria bacterium]